MKVLDFPEPSRQKYITTYSDFGFTDHVHARIAKRPTDGKGLA